MQHDDHFPLIEVSGTPYERGVQHGTLAAARVKRSVEIYASALKTYNFPANTLRRILDDFTCAISAFDNDYVDEMRGIAAGAGVSYDEVLMINARTEIVAQARRLNATAATCPPPADECTSVAILPVRSATGELIQGQNWDNRIDCAETVIILRVLRDDGPDVLTFVEAGCLARYGMNSEGITLNGNGLSSSRDYSQSGVPLPLVRRKALEQDHYALALQVIVQSQKACSCNILLGTKLGFAVTVECAPDESFLLYPKDGAVVHANHWVSQPALAKLRDIGVPASPESMFRHHRVESLIQDTGASISTSDLKRIFADTSNSPFSVCRPARMSNQGYSSCTTATLLMQPARGILEVAMLPAQGASYFEYPIGRGQAVKKSSYDESH